MNNYVEAFDGIAFIFNGCTFEKVMGGVWVSMKTCIDPAVNSVIQRKGTKIDDDVLKILANQIKDQLLKF